MVAALEKVEEYVSKVGEWSMVAALEKVEEYALKGEELSRVGFVRGLVEATLTLWRKV